MQTKEHDFLHVKLFAPFTPDLAISPLARPIDPAMPAALSQNALIEGSPTSIWLPHGESSPK